MQKINSIGIDKIVLSLKFNEFTINLDKLIDAGADIYYRTFKNPYIPFIDIQSGKTIKLNNLKLTNKNKEGLPFNTLMIGCKKNKSDFCLSYATLDVTLPTVLRGTNEFPINDIITLKIIIGIIEQRLIDFGLNVDLASSVFKELEINTNIYLKKAFYLYRFPLEYIKTLIPDTLKSDLNTSYGDPKTYTGFKVGNKSRSLKFYDKKIAIQNIYGENINNEILRIEYRLKNSTTIKNDLGFNTVGELINSGFKNVEDAFNHMFTKDVYNHMAKDIKIQKRALKASFKKNGNIQCLLDYMPIDIKLILDTIKINDKNGNYSRNSKRLIQNAYKKQKASDIIEINKFSYFGNIDKINEILDALQFKTFDFQLTGAVNNQLIEVYNDLII